MPLQVLEILAKSSSRPVPSGQCQTNEPHEAEPIAVRRNSLKSTVVLQTTQGIDRRSSASKKPECCAIAASSPKTSTGHFNRYAATDFAKCVAA
jgi:hypothetical protein